MVINGMSHERKAFKSAKMSEPVTSRLLTVHPVVVVSRP